MSSLLHFISTTLVSPCHQQQLPEKDVHPAVWIQSSHTHKDTGSSPGSVEQIQMSLLDGTEGAHHSLGKVLITLHCLSFTGFWCLRSWMWCYGLWSLLAPKEKHHDDLWHFPFSCYSLSQQWCQPLMAWGVNQSQHCILRDTAIPPLGTGGLVCFATTPSPQPCQLPCAPATHLILVLVATEDNCIF